MIDFSRPQFITFEGGEGSGKSTQSRMLYEYLLTKRIKAIHTREIGGTAEAEKIRNLIIYSDLSPMSELMLIMAARYEHINKCIIPALLKGFWVICDRFIDSTACYQSGASGITMDDIYKLHEELMTVSYDNEVENIIYSQVEIHDYGQQAIMPDLTFFMDLPPALGLKRATQRGDINKFENKQLQFHEDIYQRYKHLSSLERNQERFISISCLDKNITEIHQEILSTIFKYS